MFHRVLAAARDHAVSPKKGAKQQNPTKELEDYRVACQQLHKTAQGLGPMARNHLEDNRDVIKFPVENAPFPFFVLVDRPSSPDTVGRELLGSSGSTVAPSRLPRPRLDSTASSRHGKRSAGPAPPERVESVTEAQTFMGEILRPCRY
jgi:hypothetical protein